MIDHIGLNVRNIDVSKKFYEAALKPIGYALIMEFPGVAGFGEGQKPDFWLGAKDEAPQQVHIAFASKDRATVDAFYAAAIAAGGRDNGAPGLRPMYHPAYYGAFVLDPDGHNIEV